MIEQIEAIFIDLGDTMRILVKDEDHMARARRRIAELVGTAEDPDSFYEKLNARYKTYRDWAFANLREAPEAELWTRWMTPEFKPENIEANAIELSFQFRQSKGRRVLVNGGKEVVVELFNRGYTLGIISNLITSQEVPDWMQADGFTPYFKSVLLSSTFGIRKPHPAIYHEAARRAEVEPTHCAYVGDNFNRDVTGTRAAGFGMVVILTSPEVLAESVITDENRPDVIIHDFRKLLDIFPGRNQVNLL